VSRSSGRPAAARDAIRKEGAMRRILATLAATAFMVAALAAPVAAATPFLDVQQDKGSSAWADSYVCTDDVPDVGDSTCVFTNAYAFDGWTRYNGDRFHGKSLCTTSGTSVYDDSAQTYTDTYSSGCLEGANVTFGKNLATASGTGTVPTESQVCVYDIALDTQDCTDPVSGGNVAVHLVWTATSPLASSSNRNRDDFGDCTSTSTFRGSSRDASVSGTLDGNAVTFDSAQIGSGKGRFTYSCH